MSDARFEPFLTVAFRSIHTGMTVVSQPAASEGYTQSISTPSGATGRQGRRQEGEIAFSREFHITVTHNEKLATYLKNGIVFSSPEPCDASDTELSSNDAAGRFTRRLTMVGRLMAVFFLTSTVFDHWRRLGGRLFGHRCCSWATRKTRRVGRNSTYTMIHRPKPRYARAAPTFFRECTVRIDL